MFAGWPAGLGPRTLKATEEGCRLCAAAPGLCPAWGSLASPASPQSGGSQWAGKPQVVGAPSPPAFCSVGGGHEVGPASEPASPQAVLSVQGTHATSCSQAAAAAHGVPGVTGMLLHFWRQRCHDGHTQRGPPYHPPAPRGPGQCPSPGRLWCGEALT